MCVRERRRAVVLCELIVTTNEFINKCAAPFDLLMQQKANKVCHRGVQLIVWLALPFENMTMPTICLRVNAHRLCVICSE